MKQRHGMFILFVLLFTGITLLLCIRLRELDRERLVFEALADEVGKAREQTDSFTGIRANPKIGQKEEKQQILPAYESVYQKNSDLAGWVRIEETQIDYPVMFTPEEVEFYLHRDFYGQNSYSGTPFLGQGYRAGNQNQIIFGHHMRNGTMFSDLMKYQDAEFWKEHRMIQFDSLFEVRNYEIFAAGFAPSPSDKEKYIQFYAFTGGTLQDYQAYIQLLKEYALYETGVWPNGTALVLLVTCSYQKQDGRFFVAAFLKEGQRQGA